MGRVFIQSLSPTTTTTSIYKCKSCQVDLAGCGDLCSKHFQGRHGKAYLFTSVVNIMVGPNEDRLLNSGLHTVNDIYCTCCQQLLGWKYVKAYEEDQKHKEGKFILEKAMLVKEVC